GDSIPAVRICRKCVCSTGVEANRGVDRRSATMVLMVFSAFLSIKGVSSTQFRCWQHGNCGQIRRTNGRQSGRGETGLGRGGSPSKTVILTRSNRLRAAELIARRKDPTDISITFADWNSSTVDRG